MPGYFSKGWFYVVVFGVEVLVVFGYAIMRVDLRFWVPEGAERSGGGGEEKGEKAGEMEGRDGSVKGRSLALGRGNDDGGV